MGPPRNAVNWLATFCIVLPIATMVFAIGSPYGRDQQRVWLDYENRHLALDIADGSGKRSLVSVHAGLIYLPGLAASIWWILRLVRKDQTTTRSPVSQMQGLCEIVKILLVFASWFSMLPYAFDTQGTFFVVVGLLSIASACVVGIVQRLDRRRLYRLEQGRCVKCGYSLTGNVSGVCPECGTSAGLCQQEIVKLLEQIVPPTRPPAGRV